MRHKLAIVATHPIQYAAPVFRHLAESKMLTPKVFYTWSQTADGQFFDAQFGKHVRWDIPLLSGYEFEFVPNRARSPGSHRFFGIRNPTLLDAIDAFAPDAILVYGWNNCSHLRTLQYFKNKVPVLMRGDSTLLDIRSRIKSLARRLLLTWIYRHIDVALSVGKNSRDYFAWCGVASDRIAFAPHCIDNDRFEDTDGRHQRQADAWRTELGIDTNDLVVVFAGKLIKKKDPLLLLQAFLRTDMRAHLVFFGSGEMEPQLRTLAQEHPSIHFMPFQNQSLMPAVYRLGDVFALPSRGPGETWGLALNEAMASRRPVIASSMAGATRDLVREGITGWSFPAGELEALTSVLRTAIAEGRSRLRLRGESAYRLIRHWSVPESARAIAAAVVTHIETAHQ